MDTNKENQHTDRNEMPEEVKEALRAACDGSDDNKQRVFYAYTALMESIKANSTASDTSTKIDRNDVLSMMSQMSGNDTKEETSANSHTLNRVIEELTKRGIIQTENAQPSTDVAVSEQGTGTSLISLPTLVGNNEPENIQDDDAFSYPDPDVVDTEFEDITDGPSNTFSSSPTGPHGRKLEGVELTSMMLTNMANRMTYARVHKPNAQPRPDEKNKKSKKAKNLPSITEYMEKRRIKQIRDAAAQVLEFSALHTKMNAAQGEEKIAIAKKMARVGARLAKNIDHGMDKTGLSLAIKGGMSQDELNKTLAHVYQWKNNLNEDKMKELEEITGGNWFSSLTKSINDSLGRLKGFFTKSTTTSQQTSASQPGQSQA